MCCSLFLKEFQAFSPATLLKLDSNPGDFLWNLQNCEDHVFWRTFAKGCFYMEDVDVM